jgi:multidrug efflux pump subunit AcrB
VVTARYPGANAQVIADTVGAPIEQQIYGVEGSLRLESESRDDGSYTAFVRFKPGIDPDLVLILVESRVALAKTVLPEAVQDAGLTVEAEAAEKPENHVAIVLVDRGQAGWDALRRFSEAVVKRLSAEGAIERPETFPGPEEKKSFVDVDRHKCREYAVPLAEVFHVVSAAGGKTSDELKSLKVRSEKGDAVALEKLATIELRSGPTAVYRVDLHDAVRITGSPPQGKSAKAATAKCAQIAEAVRSAQEHPAGFAVMTGL